MRVIFEEVENEDFFEIILRPREIEGLVRKGVVANFPKGMYGKRNLNVFVRQETSQRILEMEEEDMPLLKGKENIGKNIKEEEKTHPHKQAVAIALNVARKGGAKIPKKKKGRR